MRGSIRVLLALQVTWLVGGCTHIELRKHTNQQLRTSSDIIQQQVMDNVAKTVGNSESWPEFSNFSDGTTQLADLGEGTMGLRWNARTIFEEAFGIKSSRQLTERWGMSPVTDPSRLRAMWAVYHYTVYGTVPELPHYSGSQQLSIVLGQHWQELIPPPGWFNSYCDHEFECAEKVRCGCVTGHHCDTRVCVIPGYEASLQQLTFVIMYISSVTLWDGNQEAEFPTGAPGLPTMQPAIEGQRRMEGGMRRGPAMQFNRSYSGTLLSPIP